eukprot:Hpha_TRINITY_DN16199_c1_g1::TRINITY_DN16199_c1_g1_i1::g.7288::m.7288
MSAAEEVAELEMMLEDAQSSIEELSRQITQQTAGIPPSESSVDGDDSVSVATAQTNDTRSVQVQQELGAWFKESWKGLEDRIKRITERIGTVARQYGDSQEVAQAVLQAYARLSQIVSSAAAQMLRAGQGFRAASVLAISESASVAADWGDRQSQQLRSTFEQTWHGFSTDVKRRAQSADEVIRGLLSELGVGIKRYSMVPMPDASALQRALTQEADRAAKQVQERMRKGYPIVGFTLDSGAEILSTEESFPARVMYLVVFLLSTIFNVLCFRLSQLREAFFGEPRKVSANSAWHS